MAKKISFIHAADLHLDSLFRGLSDIPEAIFEEIRNSTFTAVDNLVNTAINRRVDFVLLVGDLFDNEKQSLKAQIYLRNAFEQLKNAGIYVYMSYGNHDHINGNIHPITYPDNVFIFPNETVSTFTYEKNGESLATVYGFSYENRAVMQNKVAEYERIDSGAPFHIATLHGTLHGNEAHDPYAPFSLSELKAKRFDYWALGHIHQREELSQRPPIVYPGNVQGRHRHETGAKGSYYVHMTEADVQMEFMPHHAILFQDIPIDLDNVETMADVEQLLREKVDKRVEKQLLYVRFTTTNSKWLSLEQDGYFNELFDVLNDYYVSQSPWVYFYRFRIHLQAEQTVSFNDYFIGQLAQTMEAISLQEAIKDLYEHPDARKFLHPLDERTIKEQASQLLFHDLIGQKRGDVT